MKQAINKRGQEQTSVDKIVQMHRMGEKTPGAMFTMSRKTGPQRFTPPAE